MPTSVQEKTLTVIMLLVVILSALIVMVNKVIIVELLDSTDADMQTRVSVNSTIEPHQITQQMDACDKVDEAIVRHMEINRVPEYDSRNSWDSSVLQLTESEKLIFATIIRLECGGCTYECQMAAASVIVNRMLEHNKTLREVIFEKGQFTPARLINKETGESNYLPYELNWQVVEDICTYGPTLPSYVLFFRSEYYHKWAEPYAKIGDLYFSYIV